MATPAPGPTSAPGDTNQADNFKAIGMPIILIATFAVAIAVTQASLRTAFKHSKQHRSYMALFVGALTCTALSFFLYFTAAWAYGLVCTLVTYLFALVANTPASKAKPEHHARQTRLLFVVVAVWFALLIGIPATLTDGGVIHAISARCAAWYGVKAHAMCKAGWLAFAEIVAMVLIASTFLAMLTLMAAAFSSSSDTGAAWQFDHDEDADGAYHRAPAAGDGRVNVGEDEQPLKGDAPRF